MRPLRFNPLAGIRAFQTPRNDRGAEGNDVVRFNPLAGIRAFQTTQSQRHKQRVKVSIPLRGLGLFRLYLRRVVLPYRECVSIPLRGLGLFRPGDALFVAAALVFGFNPLAGIRAFQTKVFSEIRSGRLYGFQSPCGD